MQVHSALKFGLIAAVTTIMPVTTMADVLTVAPTQAIVLPADASGMTKVALLYDLSGMRQGAGRRIDEALVDWRVAGIPSSRRSDYAVYAALGPWTALSTVVLTANEPDASWRVEPFDYQRNQGGFVRLDIQSLVKDWTTGARQNFGIVVATADVDGRMLTGQLSGAILTIRYGFIR